VQATYFHGIKPRQLKQSVNYVDPKREDLCLYIFFDSIPIVFEDRDHIRRKYSIIDTYLTRSQAVARIADRTALQQTI